jgi:hypothetical protein
MAAAQWQIGRVLMDVEVHFLGEDQDHGWEAVLKREGTEVVVLEGWFVIGLAGLAGMSVSAHRS